MPYIKVVNIEAKTLPNKSSDLTTIINSHRGQVAESPIIHGVEVYHSAFPATPQANNHTSSLRNWIFR